MSKSPTDDLMSALKQDIVDCISDALKEKTKDASSENGDSAFRSEVIDRLARIEEQLKSDYKALHGNGKKGLLDRVSDLENSFYAGGMIYRVLVGIVAWIVTTAVAIYAAVKN